LTKKTFFNFRKNISFYAPFFFFRCNIFSVVKHFQQNNFLEEMTSLKIFFGVWLIQKDHQRPTTDDEIPLLVGRISATVARFQQWRPESDSNGQILTSFT
jgi:hypothetical protein